ncbi:MAG: hypothetical protein QM617_00775, partial [Comamonas sp.]
VAPALAQPPAQRLPALAQPAPQPLRALADFLAQPVQAFFAQRLRVPFQHEMAADIDDESFGLDGLAAWRVNDALCERLRGWVEARVAAEPAESVESAASLDSASTLTPEAIAARVQAELARLRGQGQLPLAGFGELAAAEVALAVAALLQRYAEHLRPLRGAESRLLLVRHEAAGLRLEDSVPGVRMQAGAGVHLQLISGRLHEGASYKWQALLRHWATHLALQTAGAPVRTLLVSASGDVVLAPLPEDVARAHLDDLLDAWADGLREPLPVASRTALAWLGQIGAGAGSEGEGSHGESAAEAAARKAERAARQAYEGGYAAAGERDRSAALARAWPDFDGLLAGGAFAAWAERLYRPLLAHLRPRGAAGELGERDAGTEDVA